MGILIYLITIGVFGFVKERDAYELMKDDYTSFVTSFKDTIRVISVYAFSPAGYSETNRLIINLSKIAKEESLPITFAKLDSSLPKNKATVDKYPELQSLGVIYFLQNSLIPYTYKGPLSELFNFFKSRIHKIHKFTDIDHLKSQIMEKFYFEGLVLGVFTKDDVALQEVFTNLTYDFSHIYNFGIIDLSEDLYEELEVNQSSIVVCRGPGLISSLDVYYKSNNNLTDVPASELIQWVHANINPHIAYRTKIREPYLPTKFPLVTLFLDFNQKLQRENAIDLWTTHSRRYHTEDPEWKKFTFAIADRNEYLHDLKADGLDHLKMVFIINFEDAKYVVDEDVYKGDGEFNQTGIVKFYSKFLHEKPERFVKKTDSLLRENRIIIGDESNIEKILEAPRKHSLALYVYKGVPKHIKAVEEVASLNLEIVKVDKGKVKLGDKYNRIRDEYLLVLRPGKDTPELYKDAWKFEDIAYFIKFKDEKKEDL